VAHEVAGDSTRRFRIGVRVEALDGLVEQSGELARVAHQLAHGRPAGAVANTARDVVERRAKCPLDLRDS
jgi:hypothetical protein